MTHRDAGGGSRPQHQKREYGAPDTYGNIGTKNRLELTLIGDAANRAARIESMGKTLDRSFLVSEEFARNFPDRFESLGHHELGGVEEPVEMFGLRLDRGQYT